MRIFQAHSLPAPQTSVTRQLASAQDELERLNVPVHYLGAGYPNPEVSDPSYYRNRAEEHLGQVARSSGKPLPQLHRENYRYTDTLGPLSTRETFAKVYGDDFHVAIDPKHLVPSMGATGGIDYLCSLFEHGPVAYIVDAPTYPGFVTRASEPPHARFFSVGMDAEGPDPDEMRTRIREARAQGYFVAFYYTVPDGHNPAGISFSTKRREEIYRVVCEEDILLVEDSPYSYISYAQDRPLPFMSQDVEGRVIHLFTASKIGLPGPRIGFAYAPGSIEVRDGERVSLSKLIQAKAASRILLQNPQALRAFEAYLHGEDGVPLKTLWDLAAQKVAVYRENRDILLAGLEAIFGKSGGVARWTVPEAGFFSVITFLDRGFDSGQAAKRLLKDHRVTTVPMAGFYAQDARDRDPGIGKNQLRLAFSYTKGTGEDRRRELEEAVQTFGRGVQQILAGR